MNKHGKCYGFPLWKSSNKFIELWVCFSSVEPHKHEGQNSLIIPLFGWAEFHKCEYDEHKTMWIEPRFWFKAFPIYSGIVHWFTLKSKYLVFLNISNKPFSASKNFQTT